MKKLFCMILASLLALSMTGAAFAAEPVIVEPQMPLTDTPVTYEAMIVPHALDTGDPNEKPVYVEREEKTGVDIHWTVVPDTSKAERIATTFASGELPDLFVNMLGNNEVLTYGMAGALLPVSDYLEYMPNFASILETMPDVKAAVTMPDGKIYGIPQVNMWSVRPGDGVYARTSVFINREWLAKLNLEAPTTTEAFLDVLRAFKTGDPNDNGEADEIPLSFVYNGWSEIPGSLLYGPFGLIGMGYQMNVKDGKCFYAIQDERYIDAVKYIRSLWTEGLIDPEAFTQDAKRYYAKGLEAVDQYGVFIDWAGGSVVGNEKVGVKATDERTYVPMAPLTGPDGDCLWSNEPAGINTNRLCIASTVENPELICRWADALFVADTGIQEIWGQFGTHNRKNEDGTWTRIAAPADVNGDEWLLQTTTRQLPALITDEIVARFSTLYPDGHVGAKSDEVKCQLASIYAPYAAREFYPSVVLSEEANERVSVLWTPIKNAMIEQEVAWCTGEGDIDAEYAPFISKLESMGLPEIVEIYQNALDALK